MLEKEQRSKWLAQLGRLYRSSVTDTSIRVNADNKGTRISHFLGRKIPQNFFWELQYRPAVPATPAESNWISMSVVNSMETEVAGLKPGTQYSFRARTCLNDPETGLVQADWSVEVKFSTSGVAPRAHAASHDGPAAAEGTGKKAKKKAKQGDKGGAAAQVPEKDPEVIAAEAAAEDAAKKEKEDAFKAAMEAAAADYAQAAAKAKVEAGPTTETSEPGAAASKPGDGKSKKKKKNKSTQQSNAPAPTFFPTSGAPSVPAAPRHSDQPAMLPPRGRNEVPVAS